MVMSVMPMFVTMTVAMAVTMVMSQGGGKGKVTFYRVTILCGGFQFQGDVDDTVLCQLCPHHLFDVSGVASLGYFDV